MKKLLLAIMSILTWNSIYTTPQTHYALPFDKVIIWGHKLHTHTHSYIHWAFSRAFKHLGYETHWVDHTDSLEHINLSNSLFITEGQVDRGIPIRNDCLYIIHNCKPDKYKQLFESGRCIILQVYTHDCVKRNDPEISKCFHADLVNKIIYMPWATDLLPYEIDAIKQDLPLVHKNKSAYFVGTIGGGTFGNIDQINQFKKACSENNITFESRKSISMEDNIKLVQQAYMAPALQGEWQCKQGYIPCRIFKNISYGTMGITNSQTVYELFEGKIVYNANPYQLFYDAKNKLDNLDIQELYELMDFVRDNHTYLNRIDTLLSFFEQIYQQY